MARVNKKVRNRIMLMVCLYAVMMLIVVGALFFRQIVEGPKYRELAYEQQTRDTRVAAKRGAIYDRNMKVLAQSADCETVKIDPIGIQDAAKEQEKKRKAAEEKGEAYNEEDVVERVVSNLVRLLDVDEEWLRGEIELQKRDRTVKKQVDQSVVNEIRALELPGVFFEQGSKRYYPYSSFASHIIGFTDIDGTGIEGLEKTFDSTLSGTAGRIQVVKAVNDKDIPHEYENFIAPEDGRGIVLTIDEVLQHYVEKYLEEAYNLYDIRNGGACIMMDANTGEILAMAVEPNYDLNAPRYVDEEQMVKMMGETEEGEEPKYTSGDYLFKLWRNKAVCDSYEPGSTFKAIVAAAAIESGAVNPQTDTFTCKGSKQVSVHTIHCHKRIGHGDETFYQALENSCNPAFMEMGAKIGNSGFRSFYEAFGFTQTTNFALPGETQGIFFSEKNFNEVELATSSFGQGFQITPLQMITAFSAVVNGGKLMKPQLIKGYTDADGRIIETVESEVVREVVSESTSRVMRAALEGVVANGTGSGAYVAGYRIGGKTGTSEKRPRGQGKYVASFIGFAPADDPQIVCLLILDEPGGALTGGGAIAAPAVGKILSESLKYLGYEPEYTSGNDELKVKVPEVVGMARGSAVNACKEAGLSVTIKGNGEVITNQLPKANSKLLKDGLVILYTDSTEETRVEMPNFVGMTKNEATQAAKNAGLNITINGGGESAAVQEDMVAIRQSTPAGETVVAGSVVTVDFALNSNE